MRFLLDTNICVFLICKKSTAVLTRLQQCDPDEVGLSSITVAELCYGAEKSWRSQQNHLALDAFLTALIQAEFDAQAADRYGRIRADLERRGVPIGPLDMLIAAQALGHGVPLITNNTREFSRVSGLVLEDWSQPQI